MITENHAIYDAVTGNVEMLIRTSDPMMLAMNTPIGCKSVVVVKADAFEVKAIDTVDETVVPLPLSQNSIEEPTARHAPVAGKVTKLSKS